MQFLRKFEALTNPERLVEWWETTSAWMPRLAACTRRRFRIDDSRRRLRRLRAPRKLSFAWPLAKEDRSVVTTVEYELHPRGPQTAVHVAHHSPETVAGDWGAMWQQALDLLKSYLEATEPASSG